MEIKDQDFNLISADFDFSIDAEFEVEIKIDQPCFANCTLVVFGWVDADEYLYPYCVNYRIRTSSGAEKFVSLDVNFDRKLESYISDLFQKKFESYCDDKRNEFDQNRYEDSINV